MYHRLGRHSGYALCACYSPPVESEHRSGAAMKVSLQVRPETTLLTGGLNLLYNVLIMYLQTASSTVVTLCLHISLAEDTPHLQSKPVNVSNKV